MPLQQFTLADTPDALADGLNGLSDLNPVGVDVERADWNRYYRAAALIQVGGGGRVVLVDPLQLRDLAPLHDWLASRTVVFHAVENDLQPLASVGVAPRDVADTAIAAAMLGLPTGLETLLGEQLGIELASDKSAMQRADWEARPIADEMLTYAAADVADLPALWTALRERLAAAERLDWYTEELAARIARPSVEERRDWTRLPGLGRLDPASLNRARALWDSREELARSTDTAPGRIAGDKVLVDLATRPPDGPAELGRRGMRRQAVRDFGAELLAALEIAAANGPPGVSTRHGRAVMDEDRASADQLRVLRAERADELGIDAGVLCPNRILLGAVLANPGSAEDLRAALDIRDWQWAQLKDVFVEALDLDAGAGADETTTEEEQPDG